MGLNSFQLPTSLSQSINELTVILVIQIILDDPWIPWVPPCHPLRGVPEDLNIKITLVSMWYKNQIDELNLKLLKDDKNYEEYSLDRIKMSKWIWPKFLNMTEKLTTTNNKILYIMTSTNLIVWIWPKLNKLL